MRVLAVSDKVEPVLYSPAVAQRVGPVDMVLACGDLPFYYIEYLMTMLSKPTYYVFGNHMREVQYTSGKGEEWSQASDPLGACNLHGQTVREGGLLMAGLEGSMRYNRGAGAQYTENEMWGNVIRLAPRLLINRIRHGRWLDVLVTHSPPRGIHDKADLPHQGFTSFLYLMRWFKPRYLLHGHIHIYRHDEVTHSHYASSEVINVYPYRVLDLEPWGQTAPEPPMEEVELPVPPLLLPGPDKRE